MRTLACCFAFLSWTWTTSAHADSAIARLGKELTSELELREKGSLFVACGVVRASESVTRADELSRRVCRSVASKLPSATLIEEPMPMPNAWKKTGAASRLVYVELELARGELRASLDVHAHVANFWERLKGKKPAPVAHTFASAPIDAEVRSFLPALPLEEATLHSYRLREGPVLALACGAFGGTHAGNRLAMLTTREVLVGRFARNGFVVETRVDVTTLAPRTPFGMRPPLANLASTGDWRAPLAFGSSERQAVVLDARLSKVRTLPGVPFTRAPGTLTCATLDPNLGGYLGLPSACEGEARPRTAAAKGELYDTMAFFELVDRQGGTTATWAVREPSGKLTLDVGGVQSSLEAVGAQVALGDVDQDGALDVMYTLDSSDDALLLATFDGKGLRLRRRWPTKAPISAVAVCPPENAGRTTMAAVVGDEVWVVR